MFHVFTHVYGYSKTTVGYNIVPGKLIICSSYLKSEYIDTTRFITLVSENISINTGLVDITLI